MNRTLIALLLIVGSGSAIGVAIGIAVGFGVPALIAAIVTVIAAAAGVDRNALS